MHILENVRMWKFFRKFLDRTSGLYRSRAAIIHEFGIDRSVSVLDVGCGIGQYSAVTDGEYLGIDLEGRYIQAAKATYGNAKKRFECLPLQKIHFDGLQFDVALLMDLTHHLSVDSLNELLRTLRQVTKQYLVVTDPIKQQRSNYWGRFLTFLDRGKYIREKEEELQCLSSCFTILKVVRHKFLGVDNVMIFARPK